VRALVQRAYGPVETSVGVEEVRLPRPAGEDVCVRVRYAGLNPLDWKLVEGHFKWMSKARPPCGVGFDLAGEVHDAGRGAARFAHGARVAGLIPAFQRRPGSIAQYALVPAHLLVVVPDQVPLDQAAALPVAGLSALQMCRMTKVGPSARVLVHGASGGVGHLAVQIARNLGGTVTATGSVASHALLQSLDPGRVVDRASSAATWGGPFDAVLDCATTLTPSDLKVLLAPDGHYVATTPRFPQVIVDTVLNLLRRGQRQVLMLKLDGADLEALMQQVAAGSLRVVIERVFSLGDAAQALAHSRAGHVRGKLVVSIDEFG
jgi:NADPH:quinone reductase-like Zn-dependent oxidoreductase